MTDMQSALIIILSVLIFLIFLSCGYAITYHYYTRPIKKLSLKVTELRKTDQDFYASLLVAENQPPRAKPLVVVESPFAGKTPLETERNIRYARACLADCLQRGEYPFASHLLYTQTGVLKDNVPEERNLGIEAGLAWGECADKTVVYQDLGISAGMESGIKRAEQYGRPVEYRYVVDFAAQITNNEPLKF